MQQRYEVLMLAVPEVTQDEAKQVETTLAQKIAAGKGATISFERWGKYQLAYPINKNEYGVYYLLRFEVPQGTDVIDEMKTLFSIKLNDIVMRHMFNRLDIDGPLTYQRPRSLEEAPPAREGVTGRDGFAGRDGRSDRYQSRSESRDEASSFTREDEVDEEQD